MAASGTAVEPGQQEINPAAEITALFSKERRKQAADRDRELRERAEDFTELYVRALLDEDWRVLEFGSAEEWTADVLKDIRLDKLARERVAAQLAAEGKTTREIGAQTACSQSTAARDVVTQNGSPDTAGVQADSAGVEQVPAGQSPRQQAARQREKQKRAGAQPSGDGQNGSLDGQKGTSGAGGQRAA